MELKRPGIILRRSLSNHDIYKRIVITQEEIMVILLHVMYIES